MQSSGMNLYETLQGYADTWGVGGDRFPFYASSAFNPKMFTGQTTSGQIATLSIPPNYANLGGYASNQGSGNMAGQAGANAPWNPRESIVPWVLVGLVVGWLGIHKLYYSKKK
jgi:hypothetical protein